MYNVYRISNLINEKSYIGQTKNLQARWSNHKTLPQKIRDGYLGKQYAQVIHYAIAKYGLENFKFEVLEEVPSVKEANEREDYWIVYFDSLNNGYNSVPGGNNFVLSEETKLKISATLKAKGLKGKDHYRYGMKHTEESKRKMSNIKKGLTPWKGKRHSEETKRKISEANKGQPSARKGVSLSQETKEKISKANKGKKPWNKGNTTPESVKEKLRKIPSNKRNIIKQDNRPVDIIAHEYGVHPKTIIRIKKE